MAELAGSHLPLDLRKRIDIMAEHIARNGPEFEQTVKQKNSSNHQFAFLYGGEGAEYYRLALDRHRGGSVGTQSGSGASLVSDLSEVLQRWREPPVHPVSPEIDQQLAGVVASLQETASRDAIRNGRIWIESNTAIIVQIAGQLMKRCSFLKVGSHMLHVLYLVHDVLQTEGVRKDSDRPLIRAFKPYLPWLLRPAFQFAKVSGSGDGSGPRVLRLLQLWVERNILTAQESEDIGRLVTAPDLPVSGGVSCQPVRQVPRPVLPRPTMVRPPVVAMPRPGMMLGHSAYGMPYGGQHPMMPGYTGGCMGMPYGGMPAPPVIQTYHGKNIPVPMGQGPHTPETVPVGVMATMLKQVVLQCKNMRVDFVRYKPLDSAQTPQIMPPLEHPPSARIVERIDDFYEDLKEAERSSSSSRSSSHSRSRSRSRPRGPTGSSTFVARGLGGFSAPGAVPLVA